MSNIYWFQLLKRICGFSLLSFTVNEIGFGLLVACHPELEDNVVHFSLFYDI